MHPDIIQSPKPSPQRASALQISSNDPTFMVDLINWMTRYRARRGCEYELKVLDPCKKELS